MKVLVLVWQPLPEFQPPHLPNCQLQLRQGDARLLVLVYQSPALLFLHAVGVVLELLPCLLQYGAVLREFKCPSRTVIAFFHPLLNPNQGLYPS